MAQVTVKVFAIGQGVASLLEVWEGSSYSTRTNLFVALMDCGSDDNKNNQNVKDSVAEIKNAMAKHNSGEGFTPPYLDVLVISHQDKDHWDKLDLVLDDVKGKRKMNNSGLQVETCIQKPPKIADLDFSSIHASTVASKEQYSKIKLFSDTALYVGSQHLLIGGQDYYTNIEWGYDTFLNTASHTLQFEIDEPYLSISIFYRNKDFFSNWEFITDDEEVCYMYYYSMFTNKYDLMCNNALVESQDTLDLTGTFKKTLQKLISDEGLAIDADTIIAMFSVYDTFLTKFKYEDVVDTVDKGADLKCCIGQAFIGGQEDIYSKSFKNMRDRIKVFCSTKVEQLIKNQKVHDIYFNHTWNLTCKVLCCTQLSKSGLSSGASGNSIKHNASSAVAQWHLNDMKVLYPGDATIHTMYYMRNKDLLKEALNCIMLAPHHGSGTTSGMANQMKGPKRQKTDPWAELERFLGGIQPSEIIVSAGIDNRHGHPNCSFIKKSEDALKVKTDKHNICYNIREAGSTGRKYEKKDEECKIYTTVIYNKDNQPINAGRIVKVTLPGVGTALTEADSQEAKAVPTKETPEIVTVNSVLKQTEQRTNAFTIDINQIGFLDYR